MKDTYLVVFYHQFGQGRYFLEVPAGTPITQAQIQNWEAIATKTGNERGEGPGGLPIGDQIAVNFKKLDNE